jgi:outer membrane protein W
MKKLTVMGLVLLLSATVIHAQNFKPFKVGIGVGLAVPNSGEGGGLIYLEPGYRPSDNTIVNFRLESAIMSKEIVTTNGDVRGNARANSSYTINGQYYFNDKYIRPFVGGGLGIFKMANVRYEDGSEVVTSPGQNHFGFYPRIGLEIGHFNMAVDYNVIPNSSLVAGAEMKNSYLGVRAGFNIGGGVGVKD